MKDESRIVKDPICGKDVDTLRARAVGIFGGVTYYFCSAECKAQYKDPRKTPRRDPTKDTPLPPPAPPPPDSGRVLAPALKLVDVRNAPSPEPPPARRTPDASSKRAAESPARRSPAPVALVPPPSDSPAPASVAAAEAGRDEEPLKPSRSRAPLVSLLIVMLIIAGGVVFYTLKYR